MQAGVRVAGHRPVVRVNDGFKEAHNLEMFLIGFQNKLFVFLALLTNILNDV